MSIWIRKSFDEYQGKDVLFKLSSIYPSGINKPREIRREDKINIKKLFSLTRSKTNDVKLFGLLISSKYTDKAKCCFPITHSYVRYFTNLKVKKQSTGIDNNLTIVTEIIDQVYETCPNINDLIEAIEQPITSSRQLGQAFNNWCEKNFPCTHNDIDEWSKCNKPICLFCSGEDKKGIDWVRSNLGIEISTWVDEATGLDLMCKISKKDKSVAYIVGEAKFLSDSGGSQKKQRDAAWGLAIDKNLGGELAGNRGANWNPKKQDVRLLAILDGICWIEDNNNKFTKPLKSLMKRGKEDNLAMSALLLKDFFDSVYNE